MSDPVEQGEQVDVEEVRRIAMILKGDLDEPLDKLARAVLYFYERVRLLEQRESGLREALERLVAYLETNSEQGAPDYAHAALAASPPDEPSDELPPPPDRPAESTYRA